MDVHLKQKLSRAVPRYTSYPTAPHFSSVISAQTYAEWLKGLPNDADISLYVHIPYCDRLCWFCACATKQTRKYEPVARYLEALADEIETVSGLIGTKGRVSQLHFGGGSPTMLRPEDMMALSDRLKQAFRFLPHAEISVEIDPNDMDIPRHDALAAMGMTRASLGVQDFDEKVQRTINREQTFEQTRETVDHVRERGAQSVNIDLLYGLPHQSVESVGRTVDKVIEMAPDRIALFGYAHVPWMKKHQTMIDEAALPDTAERLLQFERASAQLCDAGYVPVGIDHFAKPGDSLAEVSEHHTLRRNFQGYTTDQADAIIGLGASSIGRLPQGYVQNNPATGEYQKAVSEGQLAAVRGFALSDGDRMRAHVIERLMCDFSLDASDLTHRFGAQARSVLHEADYLAANDGDGHFEKTETGYVITPEGRPFARLIAAEFDSYFGKGTARHSVAV